VFGFCIAAMVQKGTFISIGDNHSKLVWFLDNHAISETVFAFYLSKTGPNSQRHFENQTASNKKTN
jgi:hypothetical protein